MWLMLMQSFQACETETSIKFVIIIMERRRSTTKKCHYYPEIFRCSDIIWTRRKVSVSVTLRRRVKIIIAAAAAASFDR